MTYLPDTGMVMYRSHMHKGLKRNFQLPPGGNGSRCFAGIFRTGLNI